MSSNYTQEKNGIRGFLKRLKTRWAHRPIWQWAIVIGGLLLIYFLGYGESNIVNQITYRRRIGKLERTYRKMRDRYRSDSIRLDNLTKDSKNLERIARTEYQMTAPDEILFLITDSIPAANAPLTQE